MNVILHRLALASIALSCLVICLANGSGKPTNTAQPDRRSAYWQSAFREVLQSQEGKLTLEKPAPRDKIRHGNLGLKQIALTFDDGPHPGYTPRLLKVLRESNVKATFFVVGKMVEDHPELLKDIFLDGHVIANHTFSHICMKNFTPVEMKTEWMATNQIILEITGKEPKFCRPPGGQYDGRVIQTAKSCGLTTVFWTSDPGDYDSPGSDVILRKLRRDLKPGGILLLHSGVDQTIELLPRFIREARQAGYQFVTMDQLALHVR